MGKKKLGSQTLSIEVARQWVQPRVSERRFEHIKGVAATASLLAQSVGADAYRAELAAWLHDACKEAKDKELITYAKEFGWTLHPVEENNGHLLHGPVAAEVVRRHFGLDDQELLNAIAEHTLGAAPMTLLSKVVFLADALEPMRPAAFTQPIWLALNSGPEQEKTLDLDSAIVVTCNLTLAHLIEEGRAIHPRMIEVRNYYLDAIKQRKP